MFYFIEMYAIVSGRDSEKSIKVEKGVRGIKHLRNTGLF
jgi:hypothetical protein